MNMKPVTISIPCPEQLADKVEKIRETTSKVTNTVAKQTGRVFSVLKAIGSATKSAVKENYGKTDDKSTK